MPDKERIQTRILEIPPLPVEPPRIVQLGSSSNFETFSGVPSRRTTDTQRETSNFDNYAAFDPNADVLWPGSMVQGKSLTTGILAPIALPRAPGTVTLTNLTVVGVPQPGNPNYSRELTPPSLATAQEAVQQLVTQNIAPDTPAKMSFVSRQFFSLEQAMLQIGLSAQWLSGNVRAQLGFSSSSQQTMFLVQFIQTYFSISFNPPGNPVAFLDDAVRYDDAMLYLGDGNPPAYISTVTYGRSLHFLVSSSASALEVRATLDAAFRAGINSGSVNLSASQRQILQDSEIKVLALGGPANSTVDLMLGDKVDALQRYLREGANFSITSPGLPISYQARYLRDNDVARLALTADYEVVSHRSQNITSVTLTFNLTSDDKDAPEEIQLTVYRGDQQVGYGGFGRGTTWRDPGSYPCTVGLSTPVPVTDKDRLRVRMYKTPEGSPTGNGMEGTINASCKIEDGTVLHLFDVGERRYGDNNAYDVTFP